MRVRVALTTGKGSSPAYIELDTGGQFDVGSPVGREELTKYLEPPLEGFGDLLITGTKLDLSLLRRGSHEWPGHKVIKAGMQAICDGLRKAIELAEAAQEK